MRRILSGISWLSFLFLLGCGSTLTSVTTTITSTPTTTLTSLTSLSSITTTVSTTTTTATTTSTTLFTTTATESVAPGTFTLAELEEDYDQFVEYIDLNPKLFTDESELSALIVSQRELLFHGMTPLEFYRVLAVVAAGIRCGHTGVQVPASDVEAIFGGEFTYPIEVGLFEGQLRVIRIAGETGMQVGDLILSIDGHVIADLIPNLMRFLSADGEGSALKMRVLRDYFLSYYLLFLAPDDELEVEYSSWPNGETHTETIARDTLNSENQVSQAPYDSAFFENYAILTMRGFYPYNAYTLSSFYVFFDDFFTRVEAEGIHHLVLDLRGNSGGDPRVTSRLFSYLAIYSQPYFAERSPNYYPGLKSDIPFSTPHFDGEVYTLIDGLCFSSCGHFAALLRYQNVGTFIGEETGGSYVCSDSSASFTLSNTRLEFRTSRMVWEVAVEGFELGQGIFPDTACSQTFEDCMAGIDTVMEEAMAQIQVHSFVENATP